LIVEPEPAEAPLIPPEIVPIVHTNVLGTLDVNEMFGPVPLQIIFVFAVVTTGVGFTVTVIVYGTPGHEPVVDVGVTRYCTEPAVVVLGLVNV
jgi:hypothetical protein